MPKVRSSPTLPPLAGPSTRYRLGTDIKSPGPVHQGCKIPVHEIGNHFPSQAMVPQPKRLLAQQFERSIGKGSGGAFRRAENLAHCPSKSRINIAVENMHLNANSLVDVQC